ncbi:DUF1524 domain-containing protein [Corynebacterium uropygiale]|uniref:DUF1524 domain-containing protein n=1 Tax=Corynebacterium uropygiale TaxID=1775911 RepID=A0A9X1U871_9CORY|nr:HNH endonuclease family protein [Corynebacterium uropygiale]MCF4007507.1 DUF1524 domain-containing protein [Corynebacterium uropygiale]
MKRIRRPKKLLALGTLCVLAFCALQSCGDVPESPDELARDVASGIESVLETPPESGEPAEVDAAPEPDTPPPADDGADAPTLPDPAPEENTGAAGPAPGVDVAAAFAHLEELEVKGRAPKTGYDRALFGQAWSDDVTVEFGHNGCDTRNDILRRDLHDLVLKPGTRDCVVLSGVLEDPYTGASIPFTRGKATSSRVQIDHVVALSDAWQKGAQQLSVEQRRDLANDPRNLLAVDGPTNQAKRDGDAATWLPPNKAFRCAYAARQIDVKWTYGLWVTEAEKAALSQQLQRCS